MKTVLKYDLLKDGPTDTVTIPLSREARILSLQNQYNNLTMWVLEETEGVVLVARIFKIVGTGSIIRFNTDNYIGTVLLDGDRLVLHVFEVTE